MGEGRALAVDGSRGGTLIKPLFLVLLEGEFGDPVESHGPAVRFQIHAQVSAFDIDILATALREPGDVAIRRGGECQGELAALRERQTAGAGVSLCNRNEFFTLGARNAAAVLADYSVDA